MEPWEIKVDDVRKANSKKLFIIFCEDGAVEPTYFELFKKDNIQLSILGNKKQHHAQVDYATEHFRKNLQLETKIVNGHPQELIKLEEGAQVWCVFDRDKEINDQKDTAFNDSIKAANDKGIKTAWSNDDFELWILLHFEDVDPNAPQNFHRSEYYKRLTQILKTKFPAEQLFQNTKFHYYNAMKSKQRFLKFTYQLMKDNLNLAIERATGLEAFHADSPTKPPHKQCPCTKVHLLVTELIG